MTTKYNSPSCVLIQFSVEDGFAVSRLEDDGSCNLPALEWGNQI